MTATYLTTLFQDFGHMIHELSFDDGHRTTTHKHIDQVRKQILGISEPLNGVKAHTEKSQFMFQVRDFMEFKESIKTFCFSIS